MIKTKDSESDTNLIKGDIEKYYSNIPSINIKKEIRVATVFSGIGAVEQALKRLKIKNKIVFACDFDKFVKQSYLANYNIKDEDWHDNILDLDAKKYYGEVDMIFGGSPCQSFSSVGKRKGLNDDRGNLIYEYIRIIDECQPNVFVFENVKGLLTHNKGKTWDDIVLKDFKALGYKLFYDVLNSKDYGIPQHRDRLFLIGFKNPNIEFKFPEKVNLEITVPDMLIDNANEKYYLGKKGFEFVFNVNKKRSGSTQVNGNIALCQRANQQFNWHGDFILDYGPVKDKYFLSEAVKKYVLSTGTKNFKLNNVKTNLPVARPLLSTMASMHRAGVDNYFMYGPRIRKLTPRECLRLMGFPDSYKIVVSDTQAYKQAGNSMVVDVIMNLFDSIIKSLNYE